jgi:hypothetical protein
LRSSSINAPRAEGIAYLNKARLLMNRREQSTISTIRLTVLDADSVTEQGRRMTSMRGSGKRWLLWIIAALWLGTAVPIIALSLWLGDVPLWPSFNAESTPEGVVLWTVLAAWIYLPPILPLAKVRRKRPLMG